MFKRLILILIIAVLVACEPVLLPVEQPTPTQETNYSTLIPHYNGDCLPDGIFPINPNPCPTDSIGYDMEFVSRPSGNYATYTATLSCDDNCVIGLHDPFGRAGFAGLQIHGLHLDEGQLYIANLDGWLNAQDADDGNFAGAAFVHVDSGDTYPLREHGIERYTDGKWTRSGERDFFWCIRPLRDMTVVLEAGILAQWAEWHNGNNYVVEGMYVYPINNINLCGETHTIQ